MVLAYQQNKTNLHVLAQLYLDPEGGGQQLEVLQGVCCLLQTLECDGRGEGHLPHHAALSAAICYGVCVQANLIHCGEMTAATKFTYGAG